MRRPRAKRGIGLALGLVLLGPTAGSGAPTGGFTAEYVGYSHGLLVLRLAGSLVFTPAGYDVTVSYRAAGLVGVVLHADSESRAVGRFVDGQARPSVFTVSGHLRGAARATRITYADSGPVIETLIPPVEQERSVVPPADTRRTIDTLSAAAALIRQMGQDGRCDGTARTFDGRRLALQSVHMVGPDLLDRTTRSIFAGKALRCDIEGQQVAGFIRGENQDELRRPRRGTAWLADLLPNAPPVPVRIVFENRLLGQVTLYLSALTPAK